MRTLRIMAGSLIVIAVASMVAGDTYAFGPRVRRRARAASAVYFAATAGWLRSSVVGKTYMVTVTNQTLQESSVETWTFNSDGTVDGSLAGMGTWTQKQGRRIAYIEVEFPSPGEQYEGIVYYYGRRLYVNGTNPDSDELYATGSVE